jgi:hypothetical protein
MTSTQREAAAPPRQRCCAASLLAVILTLMPRPLNSAIAGESLQRLLARLITNRNPDDTLADNSAVGKTHNAVSILTTASSNQDLDVTGYERILLLARLGPTAASAGDLTVTVRPYEDDGITLFDQALATDTTVAAALTAGVARLQQTYLLRGLTKVQVRVTNGNAGTLPATVAYFLR